MKNDKTSVRQRMVVVRMNEKEFRQLEKLKGKTIEKTISNYLRKVALQNPVTIIYRNTSADDFLLEMAELKRTLQNISQNYNQAVKKLNLLEKIPDFRLWIAQQDALQKAFQAQVADIHFKVIQLHEQWLQK